jgi:hypothetical protein
MVALMLVMSGGFLTLNASAASQPGDLLYNLKMGMERVQLALTFNAESPQTNPDQVDDDIEMATGKEYLAPRTTNRTVLVLHGITYQMNQDGRPGVGAVAEAQAQMESSLPSFASAQTNLGNGNDKPDEGDLEETANVPGDGNDRPDDGDLEETADVPGDGNQGKALGKAKTNNGKALGHDKPPKDKDK